LKAGLVFAHQNTIYNAALFNVLPSLVKSSLFQQSHSSMTDSATHLKHPTKNIPLLPLRDMVVFPHTVLPLFVGRKRSILGLEQAMLQGGYVVLAAQKNPKTDDPALTDIHRIGCLAKVLQLLKLPDGTVKVLVDGVVRVKLSNLTQDDDVLTCDITPLRTITAQEEAPNDESSKAQKTSKSSNPSKPSMSTDNDDDFSDPQDMQALKRALLDAFDSYVKQHKKIPNEVVTSLGGIDDYERLVDTIVAHLNVAVDMKQKALALTHLTERYEYAIALVEGELDIQQAEKRIRSRVKRQMEKNQRDHYLNEQVKAIQRELGDGDEDGYIDELEKKVKAAGMSKDALTKCTAEIKKLRMMHAQSSESTVSRNYLDVMVNLPWKKKSKINLDLRQAQASLNADHDGLDKVKERIVEYLAVQQRVTKVKSPILCLVGPPGVGKTSLGQSIAKATGRQYVRMALGGVRDEAEVRGHRRTYIGALPGKVLQNLSKVKVRNPLFLLDEIDKMGGDWRGDPASALLEVLDPEQNNTFQDHYVEVDFDLSDVMFVATSNSLNIPPALLDRMEIIRLSGYTEDEKVAIGLKHLLPKQMTLNGLLTGELTVDESAVREILRHYTREAGVRSLEREISKICRKVVKAAMLAVSPADENTAATQAAAGNAQAQSLLAVKAAKSKKRTTIAPKATIAVLPKTVVSAAQIPDYLGVKKYSYGLAEKTNQVGQVAGLAWTEVGGELLTIEAVVMPGKGVVVRTGSLGDVMKESVDAARSVVRARAAQLGIADEAFEKKDLHVHAPEGATPKDGPSAGIAMTTAMVSALTGIPVKADVAMTGEITLRGEVLAIGGLKEKLLAALRAGIKTAIIPHENIKDLAEIPDNVKQGLAIIPVKWIDQVLATALERQPVPLIKDGGLMPTMGGVALPSVLPSALSKVIAPAKQTSRTRKNQTLQ
jgi:ATP-dependent Lon protease